jgi:hypothetical protein
MDDKTQNPIPFSPMTMTVNRMADAADSLRVLFQAALDERCTDEEIGLRVRQTLEHWQERAQREANRS